MGIQMCQTMDLVVMVVEPDKHHLKNTCDALNRMGINKIICTLSYQEAVEVLELEEDIIDIVIADYAIEEGKDLGIMLVCLIKKKYPGILVVLHSQHYSRPIVLESIMMNADDIFDKNRESDIEDLLGKWIDVAKLKIDTRELVYGIRKTSSRTSGEQRV